MKINDLIIITNAMVTFCCSMLVPNNQTIQQHQECVGSRSDIYIFLLYVVCIACPTTSASCWVTAHCSFTRFTTQHGKWCRSEPFARFCSNFMLAVPIPYPQAHYVKRENACTNLIIAWLISSMAAGTERPTGAGSLSKITCAHGYFQRSKSGKIGSSSTAVTPGLL